MPDRKSETERIRLLYDRNAGRGSSAPPSGNGAVRWLCSQAEGDTLEIGIGRGRTLPFYPGHVRLTAIELSGASLAIAARRARDLGLRISLLEGDAAALFASAFDFLQVMYLRFRPGLELVYAAPLPTSIALVLPPALFAVVLLAACRQAVGVRGRSSAEPLIPLLALSWILLVPTGFTFTRLFLPSQFFMVVVLVRATRSPEKTLRAAATAAAAVLVLVNLYQALIPTYRLDSIIPYRQIADDIAAISEAEGIETVLASDNSLNVESIRRYLNCHTDGGRIRFLAVNDAELARRATELNGRPFLFISHMGGKGAFIDIHQLTQGTPRLVREYVPLRNLPYNDLWKRRYTERADQPDAIDVWVVR